MGCTGFYSGILLSILLFLLNLLTFPWEILVIIATFLFLPTIIRLIDLKPFNTNNKLFRYFYRFLLGIGVGIGTLSIFNAPHLAISLIQLLMGIGLYGFIGFKRLLSKNNFDECEECPFTRSKNCPGLKPFKL